MWKNNWYTARNFLEADRCKNLSRMTFNSTKIFKELNFRIVLKLNQNARTQFLDKILAEQSQKTPKEKA